MSRRLDAPNASGGTTDHSCEINRLRARARHKEYYDQLVYLLCAELLQSHDESGISLDNWSVARALVEMLIGEEITESGV